MRRAMVGSGLPGRVLGGSSGSLLWTKGKRPSVRALMAAIVSAVGMLMLVGGQAEGAASFAPAVNYAAGDGPQSVTTGRFNGDAFDDVAVANRDSGTVSVYLGNGDGTLRLSGHYATGGGPRDVAAGDLNSDGAVDLAVANHYSNNVSILLNNGAGTFGPATNYAPGSGPTALAITDYGGDGDNDLAVTYWYTDSVKLWENNGSGGFTSLNSEEVVGNRTNEVRAADLDGDGDPDLVVGDSIGDYAFYVLRNEPSASGGRFLGTPTPYGPVENTFEFKDDLTVGDFNNDRVADVAAAAHYSSEKKVYVLLGNGNATFGGAKSYPAGGTVGVTSGAFGLTSANLDGDYALDLAVTDYPNNAGLVLTGNGDGTFDSPTTHGVGTGPRSVVPGSFGGPSGAGADLAVANYGSDNVSILLNTTPEPPACSDLGDNDNDGKTDFPADPGCTSASDADETDPPTSCTIIGDSNNNNLRGTPGRDIICGLGGNDTLSGLEGNDILRGGDGTDALSGGFGDDGYEGGAGTDTADYTFASGAVTASLGTNTATSVMGPDTFAGIENLTGSAYGDTLTGSAGANRLTGGDGGDELRAGLGKDSVIGGAGADGLFGDAGNDALNSRDGVNGNDRLNGGTGTDTRVTDTREASIVGFP